MFVCKFSIPRVAKKQKSTPVLGYRLFPSPGNKQIVFFRASKNRSEDPTEKNQKASSALYIFREIQIFTSSATGQDNWITKNYEGVSIPKWKLITQVFLKNIAISNLYSSPCI